MAGLSRRLIQGLYLSGSVKTYLEVHVFSGNSEKRSILWIPIHVTLAVSYSYVFIPCQISDAGEKREGLRMRSVQNEGYADTLDCPSPQGYDMVITELGQKVLKVV